MSKVGRVNVSQSNQNVVNYSKKSNVFRVPRGEEARSEHRVLVEGLVVGLNFGIKHAGDQLRRRSMRCRDCFFRPGVMQQTWQRGSWCETIISATAALRTLRWSAAAGASSSIALSRPSGGCVGARQVKLANHQC